MLYYKEGAIIKILGIDTGSKGYYCVLDPEQRTAEYMRIPYRADGVMNCHKLDHAFEGFGNIHKIYIEKVIGRGGAIKDGGANWGASQNFGLGFNYGQVMSYMSNCPITLVMPKQWQKLCHDHSVKGLGITAKERTRARFDQLNPSYGGIIKSHDGLHDAFFIARYGLLQMRINFRDDWNFIELG